LTAITTPATEIQTLEPIKPTLYTTLKKEQSDMTVNLQQLPSVVQYAQPAQTTKQIITLPKAQASTSSTSSPQIIVLKNQAPNNSTISQTTTTTATTATSSTPNNFHVKPVQSSSAGQQPNPTILKLVSTKINRMPQILNISSQTFNNNLLKTNMRPLSATNASTSVGTNGQVTSSLVIKGNVPQTIINNSSNKPNQIVHLSKINTSKLVFNKKIRT